jgi:hypothetical protein
MGETVEHWLDLTMAKQRTRNWVNPEFNSVQFNRLKKDIAVYQFKQFHENFPHIPPKNNVISCLNRMLKIKVILNENEIVLI